MESQQMNAKNRFLFGERYRDLLNSARSGTYALPAVNVVSSSTVNGALEAAADANADIIIQVSGGGAQFYAGKGIKDKLTAQVQGAVAFALHTKLMAKAYGVNVILHTDHANRGLLPWIDGLIEEGRKYYEAHGEPLFSSHMLDLSEEPLHENIATCKEYLTKLNAIEMALEIELGITGGEEDGVDNEDVDESKLYTRPEDVLYAYEELKDLGTITVAASFGNVHGVYKPGNVKLTPSILKNSQVAVQKKHSTSDKPMSFVFHGGSGSTTDEIREAIDYGVFKMNIDTDTQFGYSKPVYDYVIANQDRMSRQIGSKDDPNLPNKKIIDPRKWLRQGELGFKNRLLKAFDDLRGNDNALKD
jgi:fructose-bisphosphate aldolase, class II